MDVAGLGARTRLLWRGPDVVLAGIGEAGRPDRTDVVADLAARTDDLHIPGQGPVAFGALPFEQGAAAEFVIPEIAVAQTSAGSAVTWYGDAPLEDVLARIDHEAATPMPNGTEPTSLSVESVIPPEVWRDEIVAEGVRRINAGDLEKVVLARELVVRSDRPIDQGVVVSRLAQTFPSAYVFNIEGFVGASPELLVARFDNVVQARPLAGTAPRGSGPESDKALADGLLGSAKNRDEHRITIDWFLNVLLPYCSYVDAEPEPSLLTVANLHHLQTLVEGRLSSPPASALELVDAVHPTPAVGGAPQGTALDVISEIERANRGRYAGPSGWVDAAGNGEFAVSVRTAQMTDEEVRLFAGVGVVADSDPQAELDETRTKFRALLGALLQP